MIFIDFSLYSWRQNRINHIISRTFYARQIYDMGFEDKAVSTLFAIRCICCINKYKWKIACMHATNTERARVEFRLFYAHVA